MSPKHAAVREFEEETGLRVKLGDILDLKSAKVRKEGEGDEYGDAPLRQYSLHSYKNIAMKSRFWVGIVRGEQEATL